MNVDREREQLRRAVEDGERLYRRLMHDDDGLTVAEDHRLHGILTRELADALALVDRLAWLAANSESDPVRASFEREYAQLHEAPVSIASVTPPKGAA